MMCWWLFNSQSLASEAGNQQGMKPKGSGLVQYCSALVNGFIRAVL
jgi:hypothetical protein